MNVGDRVIVTQPMEVVEAEGDLVKICSPGSGTGGVPFLSEVTQVTSGPVELWGVFKDGKLCSVETDMDDVCRDARAFWGYEVAPMIAYCKAALTQKATP